MPMITARHSAPIVQSLLDDGPFARRSYDEIVQVNLETVGDRIVVDARGQSARSDQAFTIEAASARDARSSVGVFREFLPRPPQM